MIPRTLEPELMDSADDAREYDAMDHAAVNSQFVTDLLQAFGTLPSAPADATRVLDLGAGTAQIPIELARRAPSLHIIAVDAARHMLAAAQHNVSAAGLDDRIELVHADAKRLPYPDDTFPLVTSNSILHHIADPRAVVAEAVRVTAPGGLLFHRDLARPENEAALEHLVTTHAADSTPYQRTLFADSLRAALTLDEMQQLVADLGFPPQSVSMTSDRHWTWWTTQK